MREVERKEKNVLDDVSTDLNETPRVQIKDECIIEAIKSPLINKSAKKSLKDLKKKTFSIKNKFAKTGTSFNTE